MPIGGKLQSWRPMQKPAPNDAGKLTMRSITEPEYQQFAAL